MRRRGKQRASQQVGRPKRRAATNSHIYRYLHSQNPVKLERTDLRRAIKASLRSGDKSNVMDQDQRASNGTSDQSHLRVTTRSLARRRSSSSGMSSSSSQDSRQSTTTTSTSSTTNSNSTQPLPSSPNGGSHSSTRRYKPLARRKIYTEADFFHDGIMEYIEYELTMAFTLRQLNGQPEVRVK